MASDSKPEFFFWLDPQTPPEIVILTPSDPLGKYLKKTPKKIKKNHFHYQIWLTEKQ